MADLLLIEDDALIQHMYQQVLGTHGHHVTVAGNGEDGLAQAQSRTIDLILLDIVMPKMNGLEMLKQLHANPSTAHTPVMILTNLMGAADAQAALDAGALKYVIKSDYTPKEVADMVDDLLTKLNTKNSVHAQK